MLPSNSNSSSQTSSSGDNITTDVVSEAALWLATILLKYCLNTVLAVCAVTYNTLNMIVFCRLGVSNGINQNFLLLSCSDFLYGVLQMGINCGLIGYELNVWRSPLAPSSFFKLSSVVFNLPHFASIIFTTVIALIRCYSVVMPLKVKVTITPRRQLALILFPFCVYFGFSANVFSCLRLVWQFNPRTNSSWLIVSPCPDFSRRQRLLDFCRTLLVYSAYTTVSVCLVVLLVALKHSSRFKKSSNSAGTGRDVQVAKTVMLVSAIFVLCNLPAMITPFLRQVWPDFKLRGILGRSFQVTLMYIETNALINACSNIFVFYSSSSLYRKAFRGLFCK